MIAPNKPASPLDLLAEALAQEQPSRKHLARKQIAEAFSVLEEHRRRKIGMAKLLDQFNTAYGFKLTLANFRRLYREVATMQGTVPNHHSPSLDSVE